MDTSLAAERATWLNKATYLLNMFTTIYGIVKELFSK